MPIYNYHCPNCGQINLERKMTDPEFKMSIDYMMEMKNYYKRSEAEKIHREIFKESSDYKHYILGMAQGIYHIYDLIKQFKDKIKTNDEWLEVIDNFPCDEKLFKEYFDRIKNSK